MDPVEIEVFATGEHTSKQGVTKVWTRDELDALATEYNTQYPDRKAPATLEHPVEGKPTPAYGWATEFIVKDRTDRKGNPVSVLVAKMVDFQAEFVEWVKKGLFRERSLGMRNGKIHHIAWLGGKLPAVAGLEPFTFSIGDHDQDEYWAEAESATPPSPNQSFSMTPEEIQALADAIATSLKPMFDDVKTAISDAAAADATAAGAGAGAGAGDGSGAGGASNNSEAENAEIVTLRQQVESLTERNQESEFSTFLDSDAVKGKFTPAERPGILRRMKVLAREGEYEFSEGSETKKRSYLDEYKDELKARPALKTLQEFATDGDSSTSDDDFEKRRKSAATANARAPRKTATT